MKTKKEKNSRRIDIVAQHTFLDLERVHGYNFPLEEMQLLTSFMFGCFTDGLV